MKNQTSIASPLGDTDGHLTAGHAAIANLDHTSYCQVDCAIGSPMYRNNVQHVESVRIHDGAVDCYTSLYRFDLRYKQLCDRTGSVKGAASLPCYADFLWFDIDAADLDKALLDARQLVVNFERIVPTLSGSIRAYFSGSKGFHIGIPAGLFEWEPSENLPCIHRSLALDLAGDVPIDTAIYEHNRLWRVPNTKHGKSGLYKVALTYEQLATWDMGQIKKLANKPMGEPEPTPPVVDSIEPHHGLRAMFEKAAQGVKNHSTDKSDARPPTTSPEILDRPCIRQLRQGVESGLRNEAALRLASAFKRAGYSRAQTMDALKTWNEGNRLPMVDSELTTVGASAFDGPYDYGCNDRLLSQLCDSSCKLKKSSGKNRPKKTKYDTFVTLSDGSMAEMVVGLSGSQFATYDPTSDACDGCDGYTGILPDSTEPYPVEYIDKIKVVRFPSAAEPYCDTGALRTEIDGFVRKYLSVSEFFHLIIPYYVLFTWLYDRFTELPYLRAIGDYGSGKTRFIKTVGAVCYKPMLTMGVASVSALFRILDIFKGTLVLDEADFSDSDENHQIVKMLNTGYQKDFPLLKSESNNNGIWQPVSYSVFGPKLIATRKDFKDQALESRCLTEHMDGKLKPGIPVNLPDIFWEEALQIRNKLLTFRFRNYYKVLQPTATTDFDIHPRLAQILNPLSSVIDSEADLAELRAYMLEQDNNLKEARLESQEGRVFKAVLDLRDDTENGQLTIKAITDRVNEEVNNDKYKLGNQRVGNIISKTLNLPRKRTGQSRNVEVDTEEAREKMRYWCNRFGLKEEV